MVFDVEENLFVGDSVMFGVYWFDVVGVLILIYEGRIGVLMGIVCILIGDIYVLDSELYWVFKIVFNEDGLCFKVEVVVLVGGLCGFCLDE